MDRRRRGHRAPALGAVPPDGHLRLTAEAAAGRWRVERAVGRAAALHDRPWPDTDGPVVWRAEVTVPALVLGSTQPAACVDRDAADTAGVDVARRRSGGGAVLVRPDAVVWVDVFLPAGDDLWERDVARAFAWLGTVWAEALIDLGLEGRVHGGPPVGGRWSDLVCFGGLGPGEVTAGGRKVVGMSQRRSRRGARFQCAALLDWDPAALVTLLALPAGDREEAVADLAGVASGMDLDAAAVESRFLARLGER